MESTIVSFNLDSKLVSITILVAVPDLFKPVIRGIIWIKKRKGNFGIR